MPVLILSSFVYFGFVSATENLPPPSVVQAREGVVACYWETYLHPQFSSRDIKANLCNHIIYGTAKLDKTTWELTPVPHLQKPPTLNCLQAKKVVQP